MTSCRLPLANKQKQNRTHQEPGYENADRNESAQLREGHRTTEYQGKKTDCRGERTEKNRSSKFCYRRRDCLPMWFSIGARLVIASDGKNREVDSQPDENCAKSNADHAEPTEKKLPQS